MEESKEESNVEASTQARNNLPDHATQMNKKLQEAANIIEGSKSTEKQYAQPATVGQPAQPAAVGQPAQPATVGQPA